MPIPTQPESNIYKYPIVQYRFNEVSTSVAKELGQVNSIVQDSLGFTWLGGEDGLWRYDGYNFKNYTTALLERAQQSQIEIFQLLVDKSGRLWIATSAGLALYSIETDDIQLYVANAAPGAKLPIHVLMEASDGGLWLGSSSGLKTWIDGEIKSARVANAPRVLSLLTITALQEGPAGLLLVGTEKSGLFSFDRKKQSLHRLALTDGETKPAYAVYTLWKDTLGINFVGTSKGVFRLTYDSAKLVSQPQYYAPNSSRQQASSRSNVTPRNEKFSPLVYSAATDTQGRLWFASGVSGLMLEDSSKSESSLRSVGLDSGPKNIKRVFADRNGDVWLAHFPQGLSRLDRKTGTSRFWGRSKSPSLQEILAIAEGRNGKLWVGGEQGLVRIDRATGRINQYPLDSQMTSSQQEASILSILEDASGHLWIGTFGGGLIHFDPGKGATNRSSKRVDAIEGFESLAIWRILEDSRGNLWFGTQEGLMYIPSGERERREYRHQPNVENSLFAGPVFSVFEDGQGEIWLGGTGKITHVNRVDFSFKHFSFEGFNGTELQPIAKSISSDKSGRVYVTTAQHGLYFLDKKNGQLRHIDKRLGTFNRVARGELGALDNPSEGLGCTVSDYNGDVWFGAGAGIYRLDTQKDVIDHAPSASFGDSHSFSAPACLRTKNGDVVFGGTQGLVFMSANSFSEPRVHATPVFTDFQLFFKSVAASDDEAPFKSAVGTQPVVRLTAQQSVFSIAYATLNQQDPSITRYAYQLEGFDAAWNYVGVRRLATYTNLNAGNYTFKVKSTDQYGRWQESYSELHISISPHWWASWWALSFYLVSFIAFIGLLYHLKVTNDKAEVQAKINQELQEIDRVKDRFLANTSHELRTPLNGMIGLSESLVYGYSGELSPKVKDDLQTIIASGRRLNNLIGDILDYSKLQDHGLDIDVEEFNLYDLSVAILDLVRPLLGNKDVTFRNEIPMGFPSITADENRLQQILYNLIGNAIKFTTEGEVSLRAYVNGNSGELNSSTPVVWIEVRDTGIGIDSESIDKIFSPFEQAEAGKKLGQSGTGLGLSISQQLVELHGGEIQVESDLAEGSLFRFSLPYALTSKAQQPTNREAKPLRPEGDGSVKIPTTSMDQIESSDNTSYEQKLCLLPLGARKGTPENFHILVVDDELVNRQVLQNLLSIEGYKVTQCIDGESAIEYVDNGNPVDLVLLDIMMPGLSGFEVCRQLRLTFATFELPIVMMSANTQVAAMEEGYASGANDFIAKPFVTAELLARVDTQLRLLATTRGLKQEVDGRTAELVERNLELATTNEDLKRMQTHVAQAEKMSALGLLVAGVGHEINNPIHFTRISSVNLENELSKFQGFTSDLLASDGDPEIARYFAEYFSKIRTHLDSIKEGTNRVTGVVESLRTFSRLDSKTKHPAKLREGLESTLQLVMANYKQQVEFDVSFNDDPYIDCVPSEINQVFMNVMVNACQAMSLADAMKEEGVAGCLSISSESDGRVLSITFKDDGPGIDSEGIKRIFEPFYTTKSDQNGTGLGMAICYDIVTQHGGTIDVESDVGKGVKIEIKLPVACISSQ